MRVNCRHLVHNRIYAIVIRLQILICIRKQISWVKVRPVKHPGPGRSRYEKKVEQKPALSQNKILVIGAPVVAVIVIIGVLFGLVGTTAVYLYARDVIADGSPDALISLSPVETSWLEGIGVLPGYVPVMVSLYI